METALQMELQDAQVDLQLVTEQYDQLEQKLCGMEMNDPHREMVAKEQGVALGQKLQLQNQIISLERFLRVIQRNKKSA